MTPLVASCSVGESNVRFSGLALSPPLTEVRHGTTWELGLTREEKDLVVDRDWRGGREGEPGLSLSTADRTSAVADPCLERITVVSSAHFSSHS